MIVLIIIFTILILILFMPIKVQIIRNDEKNDINLYFVKLFNLRFDLDEFLKRFYSSNSKVDINTIIKTISNIKIYNKLLKEIMGMITIQKSTIIYNINNIFLSVISWNTIYAFRNFINNLFLGVNNEYYNVMYSEKKKNTIEFEFIFYIRVIYLIIAYIISVKQIIKNKRKGSAINVGTSNK